MSAVARARPASEIPCVETPRPFRQPAVRHDQQQEHVASGARPGVTPHRKDDRLRHQDSQGSGHPVAPRADDQHGCGRGHEQGRNEPRQAPSAGDRLGELRKIGEAEAFGESHQVNETVHPHEGNWNPTHLRQAVRFAAGATVPNCTLWPVVGREDRGKLEDGRHLGVVPAQGGLRKVCNGGSVRAVR